MDRPLKKKALTLFRKILLPWFAPIFALPQVSFLPLFPRILLRQLFAPQFPFEAFVSHPEHDQVPFRQLWNWNKNHELNSVLSRSLKFICSEKVENFCKTSTLHRFVLKVATVKYTVEISQKFWGLLRIYEL